MRKTRPSVLGSSTSSIQERDESTSETGDGSGSEIVDVSLDVISIVLTTLRDVPNIPPIPSLPDAAGIAVNIVGIVQKTRNNKDGFKRLGEDSCALVYAIIRLHRDVLSIDDVPEDLAENIQQLVHALTSIQKFAQKGASRNFLKAMFCSGLDAGKIKDYREKLKQSMRVFGLQSDISLRETVAKLASQQVETKELEHRRTPEPSRDINHPPGLLPSAATPNPQISPTKVPVKATGNMASNKTSKTTTSANPQNLTHNTLKPENSTASAKTVTNNHK